MIAIPSLRMRRVRAALKVVLAVGFLATPTAVAEVCSDDYAACREDCSVEHGTTMTARVKLGRCMERCEVKSEMCRTGAAAKTSTAKKKPAAREPEREDEDVRKGPLDDAFDAPADATAERGENAQPARKPGDARRGRPELSGSDDRRDLPTNDERTASAEDEDEEATERSRETARKPKHDSATTDARAKSESAEQPKPDKGDDEALAEAERRDERPRKAGTADNEAVDGSEARRAATIAGKRPRASSALDDAFDAPLNGDEDETARATSTRRPAAKSVGAEERPEVEERRASSHEGTALAGGARPEPTKSTGRSRLSRRKASSSSVASGSADERASDEVEAPRKVTTGKRSRLSRGRPASSREVPDEPRREEEADEAPRRAQRVVEEQEDEPPTRAATEQTTEAASEAGSRDSGDPAAEGVEIRKSYSTLPEKEQLPPGPGADPKPTEVYTPKKDISEWDPNE